LVRLARGDTDGALNDIRVMLELAREVKDPQSLHPALSGGARIYANAGRIEEARALAAELVATFRDAPDWFLVEAAWVAGELGYADELRRLFEGVSNRTAWGRAGLGLLDGDYEAAAEAFDETGDLESEAAARLRAGESLLAEGRRAEADEQLAKALSFFRSVDATRYIREAEALLSAPVDTATPGGA
jgi:tetratricopeptide (TPR) repeat protein